MDIVEKVKEKIATRDRYARLTGVEILEARPGYARVRMTVEEKHLNSVDITHGGAIFTLADTTFALASNTHGNVALALSMTIHFMKATVPGARLTATASEETLTRRTGLYRITVEDETGDLVSVAEGLVYRKKDMH
ncbi:MAG: hydroxyphenylacetyl-CoA thioesterase PaaI [Armatimonadetes bacterium]|nr:hydroxyphenylacetyl-CoA thioesterase PaaI [Armatimonadota bacterium]